MSLSTGSSCRWTRVFTSLSYHTTPVNGGLVRGLHNKTKEISHTQGKLQKAVDHCIRVLNQNGYPANFLFSDFYTMHTGSRYQQSEEDQEEERGRERYSYLCGNPLHCWDVRGHQACLQEVQHQSSLQTCWTLHSMLTGVKDMQPLGRQYNVYNIPSSCGQALHWED